MNYIKLKVLAICMFALLAGFVNAGAEVVAYDSNTYEIDPDTGKAALIAWGKETNDYYDIPAYIQHEGRSYPVTIIAEGSLSHRTGVVVIPPTIEECDGFGVCSFKEVHVSDISAYCRIKFKAQRNPFLHDLVGEYTGAKLVMNGEVVRDLELPDDVTYISPWAFHSCGSIVTVKARNVEEIGEMAFHICPNLKSIKLGSAIRKLGSGSLGCEPNRYGFSGFAPSEVYIMAPMVPDMPSGQDYAIPSKTKILYSKNFRDVWDIFRNSTYTYDVACVDDLPSTRDFSKRWFEEEESYIKFVKEDGLLYRVDKNQGQAWLTYAYSTATQALISPQVTVDDKQYPLTKIQPLSLEDAKNITIASVPEGIREISDYMFRNCTKLTEVQLPSTIRYIGHYAFLDCESLSRINMPDKIDEIGHWAFRGSGVTEVHFNNKNTKLGVGIFYGCKNLKIATLTTDGPVPNYTFTDCVALEKLTLGEGVTELPGYFLDDCDAFTDLYLPTTVAKVGGSVFGDTKLFEKPQPRNVHITDFNAFLNMEVSNSSHSTYETVDYNLFGLGGSLFLNDKLIENLVLEPGVSVRDNIFKGCGSIKSLVMGDVDDPDAPSASIGKMAFAGCPNLKSVKVAVDEFGPSVFQSVLLDFLHLGKKQCSFDEEAFFRCWIDEVQIPLGDIPAFAFYYGYGACRKVILEEDVTSVGTGCFDGTEEVYLYRYAGEPTKLDRLFAQPSVVHVPKGRKYAAPENAPYSGCYLDEIRGAQLSIAEDNIIDDLPNPLYNGVESIDADEPDAVVTVYNLQGVQVYHGVRSLINLPKGIYLEKSAATTRKLSI